MRSNHKMLCSEGEGEAKFKPLFTHTLKKTYSCKDEDTADVLQQYPLSVKNNLVSARLINKRVRNMHTRMSCKSN